MILSNQIKCLKCGDEPYSAYRHDFKRCNCGAVAVDGGMDYLRRVGDMSKEHTKEMSIFMDDGVYLKVKRNIDQNINQKKDAFSIIIGIDKTLEKSGYYIHSHSIPVLLRTT